MSRMEEDGGPQEKQQPLFSRDDKVFAKDAKEASAGNDMYYPAAVRDRRFRNEIWQYKVHYHGWNSRFDQWLMDDRILKDTEQNRKFLEVSGLLEGGAAQRNKKEEDSATSALVVGGQGRATSSVHAASSSKRKREDERSSKKRRGGAVAAANSTQSLYEEFCELPLTLKTVLVDEMERITRIGHDVPHSYDCPPSKSPPRLVHQLPAPVTIQQVLKHFSKKRIQNLPEETPEVSAASAAAKGTTTGTTPEPNPTVQDVQDFCSGLSSLFEHALPKFLLYPQERPQYEALMMNEEFTNKPLTEIYGCEFLLRLYARLPVLMQAENNMTNIRLVGPLLADLVVLLQKNRQACFKGSYREPRPDEWMDVEKSFRSAGGTATASSKVSMDVCD